MKKNKCTHGGEQKMLKEQRQVEGPASISFAYGFAGDSETGAAALVFTDRKQAAKGFG